MPKDEIDYSNTIFYKIYCKTDDVKDIYVGHTTNFVQRKYMHKAACNRDKCRNHNLKVYQFIREHGGWNNWKMDIVGFHECNDHYEARKVEQTYFETLQATLNSIEPLPKPKPKIIKEKIVQNYPLISKRYVCNNCCYSCNKLSEWSKHLSTKKHNTIINDDQKSAKLYICICGKKYIHRQGLSVHKKVCDYKENEIHENNIVENKIIKEYSSLTHTLLETGGTGGTTEDLVKQLIPLIKELIVEYHSNITP